MGHLTTRCPACDKHIEIIMSGDANYCPTCGGDLDNDYYPVETDSGYVDP